jgi:hypothetical protein
LVASASSVECALAPLQILDLGQQVFDLFQLVEGVVELLPLPLGFIPQFFGASLMLLGNGLLAVRLSLLLYAPSG